MSTSTETADLDLANARWDLSPLVNGQGDEGARRLIESALAAAQSFQDAYRGRTASLNEDQFVTAMQELAAIKGTVERAKAYAELRFYAETGDQTASALLSSAEESITAIESLLVFFDVEWSALDDEHVDKLLKLEALSFCAHHLAHQRQFKPHLLSEAEEQVLAEISPASQGAWQRLFVEQTGDITIDLDGKAATIDDALGQLRVPDRETRRAVAEAITSALQPGLRARAFVTNTLVMEHTIRDRLRSYPHWLSMHQLKNESDHDSVQALLDAVHRHYDIVERWYLLKARLLGLDRLATYDRFAPLDAVQDRFSYAEARELVLETYRDFSPAAAQVVERYFSGSYIDAPPRPGKTGGAFCYGVAEVHPYVLLNYNGTPDAVTAMAHELGHGLHFTLSREQGVLQHLTPTTLAETASVFGETLVFERLLARAEPQQRLALLAGRLEDSIATVFRQTSLHDFEDQLYVRRAESGDLTVEEMNDLWAETQQRLFGSAIEVDDGYRSWWSYIFHFTNLPGYLYGYAFGQLLALSAYGRYREEGEAFVPKYMRMLAAGGSASPQELAAIVGIDLAEPSFWEKGLLLVEGQLQEAQELAGELVKD